MKRYYLNQNARSKKRFKYILMAVRYISSIACLRTYVKFQWGRGGYFLSKGAFRMSGDIKPVGFFRSGKGTNLMYSQTTRNSIVTEYVSYVGSLPDKVTVEAAKV